MEQPAQPTWRSAADERVRRYRPSPPDGEVEAIKTAILTKLTLEAAKDPTTASSRDWFIAAALTARDRVVHRWAEAKRRVRAEDGKFVYYFSLEFLVGRLLREVLHNLGLSEEFEAALGDLGVNIDAMFAAEPDAALGNGGLGRLAACFMESMASLSIPAFGYGIRYDHGLFRQVIVDGAQQEYPETWLSFGNPWEFGHPEIIYDVGFGGLVDTVPTPVGSRVVWRPAQAVEAIAYDTPVVGWRGRHVNALRLWSARAVDPLRLDVFNAGDHVGALTEQARAEAISKVLYPSDATSAGQELRLRQEYFFVSASLQDLLRRHVQVFGDISLLPEKAAIQLNDTHPAIAVAELMRILVDVRELDWDEAWDITVNTFSYTNHTLLPEALETWPVPLFERLLPRHMQIIYQINSKQLERVSRQGPIDERTLASVSLIDEGGGRRVKMGHLAFVGSHRVNGVSALHTELMRRTVFGDLNRVFPDRIVNKTNGITFRRWLHQANPGLTALLVEACGERVLEQPELLEGFTSYAGDSGLHHELASIRHANKAKLARFIHATLGIRINPGALFDVQIKRIHEYKRQLLNLLETLALYNAIRADPGGGWVPRVKILAGKAAASYVQAKLIIRLAHDIAARINDDPHTRDLLKLVFLPNYNVSLAETVIPAADLSEQISTASMEASGTGNMKLALNGALTIGTFDGANIEILERVGPENFFLFGLTSEEVGDRHRNGFDPVSAIAASPALGQVLVEVSGSLSPNAPERYAPIVGALRHHDHFMVTADFSSYWSAQRRVDALWRDPSAWWAASVHNTAKMGWFSSDRAVREYAEDIWGIPAGAAGLAVTGGRPSG
jgi:starch phosphorylase